MNVEHFRKFSNFVSLVNYSNFTKYHNWC